MARPRIWFARACWRCIRDTQVWQDGPGVRARSCARWWRRWVFWPTLWVKTITISSGCSRERRDAWLFRLPHWQRRPSSLRSEGCRRIPGLPLQPGKLTRRGNATCCTQSCTRSLCGSAWTRRCSSPPSLPSRIIAACQHLVWLRVVGWAFGGWVQQGKARADRLEEVKRLLLSSHGAGGKQCALRWVIMARKMCDVGRYVLRRAHLAGKLSRMARTAVLGRHWVETMYSILGLEKGHLFAHGRTVIDVNESRHRALGVRAHAELHWVLLFCVALQRTSLALFDNLLSSSTLSVAWRSRQ